MEEPSRAIGNNLNPRCCGGVPTEIKKKKNDFLSIVPKRINGYCFYNDVFFFLICEYFFVLG